MADPHYTQRPDEVEHEMPKRRPWGPASYWRSGLVIFALVIAVLLFMQVGM